MNDEDWLPTVSLPPTLESPSTKHGIRVRYKYSCKRKKLFVESEEDVQDEGYVSYIHSFCNIQFRQRVI